MPSKEHVELKRAKTQVRKAINELRKVQLEGYDLACTEAMDLLTRAEWFLIDALEERGCKVIIPTRHEEAYDVRDRARDLRKNRYVRPDV